MPIQRVDYDVSGGSGTKNDVVKIIFFFLTWLFTACAIISFMACFKQPKQIYFWIGVISISITTSITYFYVPTLSSPNVSTELPNNSQETGKQIGFVCKKEN